MFVYHCQFAMHLFLSMLILLCNKFDVNILDNLTIFKILSRKEESQILCNMYVGDGYKVGGMPIFLKR